MRLIVTMSISRHHYDLSLALRMQAEYLTYPVICISISPDTNMHLRYDDPDELARILKVLSVSTRVRILQLLRGRALCVNALAARLDVTQGAVSQHLRIMRDARLVIDEKRGYHVHYRLDEETLERWREATNRLLAPLSEHAKRVMSEPPEVAPECGDTQTSRST
jgi:DNA-binding transcriptional ArsR family regulator